MTPAPLSPVRRRRGWDQPAAVFSSRGVGPRVKPALVEPPHDPLAQADGLRDCPVVDDIRRIRGPVVGRLQLVSDTDKKSVLPPCQVKETPVDLRGARTGAGEAVSRCCLLLLLRPNTVTDGRIPPSTQLPELSRQALLVASRSADDLSLARQAVPSRGAGDAASSAAVSANLLILFDIDGTLLVDDAYAHGRAMVQAMRAIYRVDLPDDAVERTRPWGKTDLRIAREALDAEGLDNEAIDAGRSAWIEAASAAFRSEAAASAGAWRMRPGVLPALERLTRGGMRLTVLTGNLRAIAAAKVVHMGLAAEFDLTIGAYGDDAEDRSRLVPIARQRAGTAAHPWPREHTAVVGDTPGDIAAARTDGVASLLFSSARYPELALGGAGAVVSNVDELANTLEAWQLRGGLA
jgi:phosphoglycolate phosphatase